MRQQFTESVLRPPSIGQLELDPVAVRTKLNRDHPDIGRSSNLGIARVVNVDSEEFFVTLRIMAGSEQEFERVPVPMAFPGAGNRHFLGAMPEIGDHCIVGWMSQGVAGSRTKTPVILSWIVPGVWTGQEWISTAAFTQDEHSATTEVEKEALRGAFEPVRHKLRHIETGNIVASSAQGADLVLDESVTLANRRGNEFILRDADQAAILRALQQFTALAGTRIYAGMAQRDANTLSSHITSDGIEWDALKQSLAGEPLTQYELPATGNEGSLTPHPVFDLVSVDPRLDPKSFLTEGGFLDENGYVTSRAIDSIYGGKPIYRIGLNQNQNANLGASALTEYRLELAHTSDGRLPVTEQTDLFDSERLDLNNRPYIESVFGSVIGNDPYTEAGKLQYGLPLYFENGILKAIGPNTPIGKHAATLFRLTPFVKGYAPTWWGLNKQGQLHAQIGGKTGEASIDASVLGDVKLTVQGGLHLDLQGGIHFATRSKNSLKLSSDDGPVHIYGGGSGASDPETPDVDIKARVNAKIQAGKNLTLKSGVLNVNNSNTNVQAQNEVQISAVKRIKLNAETLSTNVTGKCSELFTGPRGLNPANGALHDRVYAPLFPGVVAESVTYQMGDRVELFGLGNHSTTVLVGNIAFTTLAGAFNAQAGASALTLSPAGAQMVAGVGAAGVVAAAGGASLIGTTNATVFSGGVTSVSGTTVYLGAPLTGPDFGPILCAGSLDPLTGLPFATWGLGAKNHLVGP